jgi:hypothetical protein
MISATNMELLGSEGTTLEGTTASVMGGFAGWHEMK